MTIFLVVDADDGIVERGFLGVINDLLDLLVVTADAFEHGLLVVLKTNTVERDRVVRRAVGLEEWVLPVIV